MSQICDEDLLTYFLKTTIYHWSMYVFTSLLNFSLCLLIQSAIHMEHATKWFLYHVRKQLIFFDFGFSVTKLCKCGIHNVIDMSQSLISS